MSTILPEHSWKTMENDEKVEEITVFLGPIEAKQFIEFQRYHELFNLLLEKKVFDQKAAAITLHFDNKGVLRTITRADALYSSTSQFDNLN